MATQQSEDFSHLAPSELEGLSRSELMRASPRMFDSDLLDKLSRVHPSVPPILFLPEITFMLVEGLIRGAGWLTVLYLLGGYLFWTLTEYWLHRIVFHFEPAGGSARGCTGSSTASTTTTPTIRCAWSCPRR